MSERCRTEPNASEQRLLPMEAIEQSDVAYLSAVQACELPKGMSSVLRWLIVDGRRDGRTKRLRARPQREVATRLGVAASTVSESLKRLMSAGLLSQADGEWRLDTELLVRIADEADSRRQSLEPPPVDPAEALDRLRVRPCSGVFGRVRPAGSGSVEEIHTNPVPRSVSVPSPGAVKPAEQSRTAESAKLLKSCPAWRRLQRSHFRDAAGKVRLDVPALLDAYRDAARAGLLGPLPPDNPDELREWRETWHSEIREAKVLLIATAYDLAADQEIDSPVACLASRVERGSCRRISEDGRQYAVAALRPADLRERLTR